MESLLPIAERNSGSFDVNSDDLVLDSGHTIQHVKFRAFDVNPKRHTLCFRETRRNKIVDSTSLDFNAVLDCDVLSRQKRAGTLVGSRIGVVNVGDMEPCAGLDVADGERINLDILGDQPGIRRHGFIIYRIGLEGHDRGGRANVTKEQGLVAVPRANIAHTIYSQALYYGTEQHFCVCDHKRVLSFIINANGASVNLASLAPFWKWSQ